MHIPDGFISPTVYLPAWALAAGAWAGCLRSSGPLLDPKILPRLSVVTAAVFVLSLITFPLPGGTSVHLGFTGLVTILFGFRLAFLVLSMVFFMQAFLLGDGGVTTLPINILAIAGAGGLGAALVFRILRRFSTRLAAFCAGWIATALPSLIIAIVLGVQPLIAHDSGGTPLFFPFGFNITLPALALPHLLLGIIEGFIASTAWPLIGTRDDQ